VLVQVRFGEFVFDSAARQLMRNDAPVHLTPKAFELLQVLVEERPRAMRKEELRERLWPDVIVEEANLKNLIAEIRSALGPQTIRTVHRFGYAFTAQEAQEATTAARLIQDNRVHHLKPGENLIGRDVDCAVVLDFTGVSRHHANIRVVGDQVVLQDLGSKNGTWQNDERVNGSVPLLDGDRIRFGGLPLTFRSTRLADSTATVNEG
jgi:DNA-binding winged helix-turn-helix (wHTH) protein